MQDANRASGSETAEHDARLALARVLASAGFSGSVRLQRFLTFIVNETLAGRGDRLKALSIAEAVYDKNVVNSPGSDALVRSEATRLRRVLADYYTGQGAGDPVKIVVPRGAYVPQFVHEVQEEELAPAARPRRPAYLAVGSATVVLGALGLAVFFLWPRHPPAETAAAAAPPSIAVLPFTATSGTEADNALSTSLAQEISVRLSRFDSGVVFSPVLVGVDSKEALSVSPRLQQLGANYALVGVMQQANGSLHVAAQLIDLKQKIVVWAQSYDQAGDPVTAQTDVAREIAVVLGQPNGIIVAREMGTANQNVPGYGCVIGVFDYLRTLDDNVRIRLHDCLEKTVQSNPGYASAWAALSILDSSSVVGHYQAPATLHLVLDNALNEANTAVARAPQSAFAHQALADAQFRRGDVEAFQISAQEALKLNPDDPQLMDDIGNKYYSMGRYEDGLALAKRGISLSPVPPPRYYRTLFLDAFRNQDFQHALSVLDSMGATKSVIMLAFRVMALAHLNDPSATRMGVHALLAADPDFARHSDYYFAEWRLGPELTHKGREALGLAGLSVSASAVSDATCCAGATLAKGRQ